VRFGHTLARERTLGVDHWDSPDHTMYGAHFHAPPPLGFYGELSEPGSAVDFRIYLPRLMADYAERGGKIERISPDVESVRRIAEHHDVVVVATGRRSIAELFPRDPERSPYTEPQRILTAGFFRGIEPMARTALHYQLCPEVGEIFSIRMLSFDGPVHGMNIEAIPGGPLERLAHLSYEADPAGFNRAVLTLLAEHAPQLRARIDDRVFDLARPGDLLQGGITPTVRSAWTVLTEGKPLSQRKYCLAVGDAWVVNDPIAGQGANLGSHSAFVLAEEIIAGPPYEEAFCRRAEEAMWAYARPVTEWSNAFLRPPPPHALELLAAASAEPRIANAFLDNFNDPPGMWRALGTPDGAAAWLHELA
jgi:2-polyprenyl-6-methoxyphenol hydroxylase-like FAD-dependent oxidoreductase